MFISFNGGKDCTVLLDLIHQANLKDAKQIKCIYVRPLNPFSEIEEFVDRCRQHYGITIATVDGGIKAALEQICRADPQLRACIMGSRRSDPYCERLASFQVSPCLRSSVPARLARVVCCPCLSDDCVIHFRVCTHITYRTGLDHDSARCLLLMMAAVQSGNGPGVASIDAHQSTARMDLRGHLELHPGTQRTVLCAVR